MIKFFTIAFCICLCIFLGLEKGPGYLPLLMKTANEKPITQAPFAAGISPVITTLSAAPSSFIFNADIQSGLIGVTNSQPVDNPYDNVFHIRIPDLPNDGYIAFLQYQLFGVKTNASVTRSFNDEQAIGGHFVQIGHEWSNQSEAISLSTLRKGDNVLRFTIPTDAAYYYRVKDVSVVLKKPSSTPAAMVVNTGDDSYYNGGAYLKGAFQLQNRQAPDGKTLAKLYCNNQPVTVYNGEFEVVIPKPANTSNPFVAELNGVLPTGEHLYKKVSFTNNKTADFVNIPQLKGIKKEAVYSPEQGLSLTMGNGIATGLSIPPHALEESKTISITALRNEDILPLNPDLVNVTKTAAAFRFLPHGSQFNKPVHVSIPYDTALIPEGYTAEDIRTYFFNEDSRQWVALPLDTILQQQGLVVSNSTHFTDMINGIIKVPESPQTQGYTPTSIKDIKAANPSLGINLINPPTANNMGSASLDFAFKLPNGRQGMQPNIGLQYNNEGGNGWLGLGWNLSVPFIGIDTRWGVPRYDAALETETYTIGGEQLAPIVHKDSLKARTANKQFHPRVEGAFDSIVRHGSSPVNYWWEVVNKSGTRSFYGGTPAAGGVVDSAVLKDGNGNIAYWALVETRDLNNNFVRYLYDSVSDAGLANGTVPGVQLYVRKIFYTGSGNVDGAYSVEFLRDRFFGEPKRKDIEISGRLGFKMVTADLLRKVNINFQNQRIRSYDLQYREGAFYKTLLKSISELDGDGNIFYTHNLDYYDDVKSTTNYSPLGTTQNWSPANDTIRGDISNPLPGYSNESTVLGSSKSRNSNYSLSITKGDWDGNISKSNTVGSSTGSGTASTEGIVALVDINGDGLSDKVFKKNGQLFYRPNLGGATHQFGAIDSITGVTNFNAGSSTTTSDGRESNNTNNFWGTENSTTINTTSEYFSDFNGDGLIDIASSGKVFFNRIINGRPNFIQGSTGTPSPIILGNGISTSFLTPDTARQAMQERNYPLQDIVRFWEAPFNGTITINAPVNLDIVNTPGVNIQKLDGVRVSIQLGGSVLWNTPISQTNFTPQTPFNVSGRSITKGQRVYFRVQSRYNGNNDVVKWDPIITYDTIYDSNIPERDANNRATNFYQASKDFIVSSAQSVGIFKAGKISIDGSFFKEITSDTITLKITKRKTGGIDSTILNSLYAGITSSPLHNLPSIVVTVRDGDSLRFEILSDSHIDRAAVSWKPHFQYTSFSDNTPAINLNGNPTIENYVVPNNTNFNNWVIKTPVLINGAPDIIKIKPDPQIILGNTDSITFTVKGKNGIYGKRKWKITGGNVVGNVDTILISRPANDTLFCEYHVADSALAAALQTPKYIFRKNGIDTVLPAGSYTNPATNYLGSLFRGWGHFSFKGDMSNAPLDETKINLNGFNNVSSDPALFMDTSLLNSIIPASAVPFVSLVPNNKLQPAWFGMDTSVFVTGTLMSSSRLGLHDVSVDSLMAGASLLAANKIVRSTTYSNSNGNGSTYSSTITTNELDMMDMNGDRYPDVLHINDIQFTLPNGGLEQTGKTHGLGQATFAGNSSGYSPGGSYTVASARNSAPYNSQNASLNAGSTVGNTSNTSTVTNNDEVQASWMDMNGDGLPDKIYPNGDVRLNLGYRFAAAENWGVTDIDKNQSTQLSSGSSYGYSRWFRSYQGGSSILKSNGDNSTSFDDINGDGLPDKLSLVSGNVMVQLNTGGGFGAPILWSGLTAIRKNSSTGESSNDSRTDVTLDSIVSYRGTPPKRFVRYIKLCRNPNNSSGNGISRENDQIADIDGDGFPDVLHSQNDGNLTAELSTIARTNMLRSVKRPMGSSFTVDYARVGNTYAMPQSKWVLKAVEIVDGFAGDGADTMRNSFTYAEGNYNRDEREFYGFKTVINNQLNTIANNAVYRSTVQDFLNTNHYTKGLLQSEWVQDGAGNKYSQTNNKYDLRFVQNFVLDSVRFPALVQTDKLFYEGKPTVGVSTASQFDYDAIGNLIQINDGGDGSLQDQIRATVTYHNVPALYLKNIPKTIVVNTSDGLKRRRATTIDNAGNITQIQQFLADGTFTVHDMEYDAYGNLAKITRPANYKGQRMWYHYAYDSVVHTYVTKVDDAFGYASSSTYDLRFGELLSTLSINNEPMRYTLDLRGRILSITGPYEIAAGKPYTIAFEYFPNAAVPYAITHHYDPEYNADINTVTFMDGLGRPLQVKKQVAMFAGKGQPDNIRMVVSGKVLYDAFGRSIQNRYPVTEPIGAGNTILNPALGTLMETNTYDVLDRALSSRLADGATSTMTYSIANGLFSTLTKDPLNNTKEVLSDVRSRKRTENIFGGPGGTITTRYNYDALSELTQVTDAGGNTTDYAYDNLGRKLSVKHPDAGLTQFTYDLAGNLVKKITPQIKREISQGGAIQYGYDYERLIDIDYPRQFENKVTYTYGIAGTGSRTGRLILQEDASGGQEFYYGKLGEITKTIRTVLVNSVFFTTYVSQQEYDTWNRIKKMTYPDGEALVYSYNKGGGLNSIVGTKLGNTYKYVNQLGYDEYEQRTYLQYGNGTETRYTYDSLRRRLSNLQATTAGNRMIMNNSYNYDAVSNIRNVVNNVQAVAGKLGGYAKQDYGYDNLYRLTTASGTYNGAAGGAGYNLAMGYDNLYRIINKKLDRSGGQGSYDMAYTYGGTAPHQATEIGNTKYKYDLNGNQTVNGGRQNFWDEENRLMAVLDNTTMSRYTYDADGERVVKSSGGIQGIWVNGAPAGMISHDSNYTAYVSPYLVCKRTSFTKHIYIESQRIATKIGNGKFTNISFPQAPLTAGGINYVKRLANIYKQRYDYYAGLGISPGPPTDKYYWGLPQNSGIPAPIIVDSTGSSVPRGWPGNTTQPPTGPPIFVQPIPGNDSVKAGYGFSDAAHAFESGQSFYHPDHLGSTSYVTDVLGEVSQHQEYAAFGEAFFDEHVNSTTTPYLFNAKEKDAETGLYYYGARYYDPRTSDWMSIDPIAADAPGWSPYAMMRYNPIAYTDPDGAWPIYSTSGAYLGDNKISVKGEDLAFTGTAIRNKQGKVTGYENLSQFSDNHTEFQISSNIVKGEGSTNDANEYLWIAHTANNAANESGESLYSKLKSGYSSASGSKTALSTSNNSTKAKLARAAVIDVLSGGTDPTGGATLWDGTDFLAWGLKSPDGTPQNKFEEYKSISISGDIYNSYLNSNLSKYKNGKVGYKGTSYNIPADVFTDNANLSNGDFFYNTGKKKGYVLKATGIAGNSIFWKIEK